MNEHPDAALLHRIERFLDAVPRDQGRVEPYGPLTLFVQNSSSIPLYGRPTLGATEVPTVADVEAVRARQRALGVPEALEWMHEICPGLLAVAEAADLSVQRVPLMVLDPARLPAASGPDEEQVRVLHPDSPDFAVGLGLFRAVATVGFSTGGTATGQEGPAARDAAYAPIPDAEAMRARVREGRAAYALAGEGPDGVLAGGAYQRAGDVAEIVGVATLPAARRRGLGAAVTAALARWALADGVGLVILSAGSEDIARIYGRLGFRQVGTSCIACPKPAGADADADTKE
ncbi:GNAT family N-acetyltransferase [Chondromyces apiculatus]|uniref:GNAT family N-acetyltransferase n=1 Tax=Chondromyces apiculatus TaxID=51 RepID=UPI0005C6CBE6|nr:GNAT family N-acetyltransferase [Chondromyces apiculatus]